MACCVQNVEQHWHTRYCKQQLLSCTLPVCKTQWPFNCLLGKVSIVQWCMRVCKGPGNGNGCWRWEGERSHAEHCADPAGRVGVGGWEMSHHSPLHHPQRRWASTSVLNEVSPRGGGTMPLRPPADGSSMVAKIAVDLRPSVDGSAVCTSLVAGGG